MLWKNEHRLKRQIDKLLKENKKLKEELDELYEDRECVRYINREIQAGQTIKFDKLVGELRTTQNAFGLNNIYYDTSSD